MSLKTILAAVALAANCCAAEAKTAAPASFFVVHGLPGRDVAPTIDPLLPVDVLVNGSICLLHGLTFGTIAGPFTVPAGTYNVAISLANSVSPCSGAAVITASANLKAGSFNAVVAQLSPMVSLSPGPAAGIYPIDVSSVRSGEQRFEVIEAGNVNNATVTATSLGSQPKTLTFRFDVNGVDERNFEDHAAYSLLAQPTSGPILFFFGATNVAVADRGVVLVFVVGSTNSGSATLLTTVIPSAF